MNNFKFRNSIFCFKLLNYKFFSFLSQIRHPCRIRTDLFAGNGWSYPVIAIFILVMAIAVMAEEHAPANPSAEEERVEQMQAHYAVLEEERRALKKLGSRLRHEVWGRQLPAELAKDFQQRMLAGLSALKNPRQGGSFYSSKQIIDEVENIRYLQQQLLEVEQRIQEYSPPSEMKEEESSQAN